MVSFGGFSAIPEGFETGIQGRAKELDLQGTQAFGRALQLMFSGGQGGMAPQAPPPGQASVPAGGPSGGQPGMQPLPPWSGGGPGPPGGPPPAGMVPPGASPGLAGRPIPGVGPGMPGGQQPSPATGPSPQPPMGGGRPPGAFPGMPQGGQGEPSLNLQSVIGAIVKSNPGANPAVIASAVNRFIPLMNAQSQQQWRELTLQMREQAIQQAEYFKNITAGQRERGLEETERHHGETEEASQARIAAEQRREDEAYRHHRAGEETATTRTDIAKSESQRKKEQGDVRAKQAQERLDIAKQDLQRRFAADAEKKKQGEGRLAIAQKQYDLAVQRNDLAGQRQAIQVMHLRAAEIISEWAAGADVDQKIVDQLLEQNRKYYRDLSDKVGKPAAPKTQDRAPAIAQ